MLLMSAVALSLQQGTQSNHDIHDRAEADQSIYTLRRPYMSSSTALTYCTVRVNHCMQHTAPFLSVASPSLSGGPGCQPAAAALWLSHQ